MIWILYDINTGTILGYGDNQPTEYSTDKDIAQVNHLFWDAQPSFFYRYNGLNVEVNTEANISLYLENDSKKIHIVTFLK